MPQTEVLDLSILSDYKEDFSDQQKKDFFIRLKNAFEISNPEYFEYLVHDYDLDSTISKRFQAKLDSFRSSMSSTVPYRVVNR